MIPRNLENLIQEPVILFVNEMRMKHNSSWEIPPSCGCRPDTLLSRHHRHISAPNIAATGVKALSPGLISSLPYPVLFQCSHASHLRNYVQSLPSPLSPLSRRGNFHQVLLRPLLKHLSPISLPLALSHSFRTSTRVLFGP